MIDQTLMLEAGKLIEITFQSRPCIEICEVAHASLAVIRPSAMFIDRLACWTDNRWRRDKYAGQVSVQ